MDSVVVTGSRIDSITNTQVVGVDEGGIVKVSGDVLIILRRGRLFTVSTAGGGLTAIDAVDAYPPGVDADGDWYDEMVVTADTVAVIGYSYERGGTEINRFRLSPDGRLSFRDSWHLRSDDYYSSRNYASRVVGNRLIVYSPLYLDVFADASNASLLDALPGLDRWAPGKAEPHFRRFVTSRDVYVPGPLRSHPEADVEMMHTVQNCDLSADDLRCTATVVLGPEGRTFFVSSNAVYVWTNFRWGQDDETPGWLFRIPLEGGRPSAVLVEGAPVDQFSFRADETGGRLDVLVTSDGRGSGMWDAEFARGEPLLLRLPMRRFGDGSRPAARDDYTPLPSLGPDASVGRNRYVGDHLLFGLSRWEFGEETNKLVVVPLTGAEAPTMLDFPEGVDRIESLGRDALVIGGDGDAAFVTVDLTSRATPAFADRYVHTNTSEAESRSHAFFYRPDPGSDGSRGLLGLPVTLGALSHGNDVAIRGATADMLFLRRADRRLSDFGRLAARAPTGEDDGCVASCVDWYGNARPIFLGERVFALLGYELVEGDRHGDAIRETRRLDFTPRRGAEQGGRP
ncbi:MAG: beta-propeller domain-containing protein [Brevundimonas sp.]